MDFHELVGFAPCDPGSLQLQRSRQLRDAMLRNSDFKLLEALAEGGDGGREALIVDVHCDEMPNRNPEGLLSPERLAIVASCEATKPPTVLALRKNFPSVMHLNATPAGEPRSLCLYFEPQRAVMRTWTAPTFLRRIQWWLLKSAQGALHATDQPVELPFFDTGWELILPADFDELRKRKDLRFYATFVEPAHLRGSSTIVLRHAAAAQATGIGIAIVDCPPIVQGARTDIPFTIGAAVTQLAAHGLDVPRLLRDNLQEQISPGGEALKGASNRFLILLNIPVCRAPGTAAERTQRLALLMTVGRLELGLRLGAYSQVDGKVFKDVAIGGQGPLEGEWRDLQTLPAAVLDAPRTADFRHHSAAPSEGPGAAVLVGSGALGSELLNLWVRAGWGTWTVVDSDHIKPHNIARHAAFFDQMGTPKAIACQALANSVYGKDEVVRAIVADASDTANPAVDAVLAAANLVIDCSAAVDFPRLATASSHSGRHASLFLTPSGAGSVLLLEDAERQVRLQALEAQYYRAILNNGWGQEHLVGNQGSFWSGASCRDISFRLPHSSIVAHAGNLAEQLMRRYGLPQAVIQVWSRDAVSGRVEAFDIEVHPSTLTRRATLSLHMDGGLELKLRQLRNAALPKETGGVLLGYHDVSTGDAVIVDALPAPPDSDHGEGHFVRGVDGLLDAYRDVQRRTGNVVGYLGEWHSHPPGHSARPSGDDILQLFKLALGMVDEGLPVIQLIVGERDLNLYVGEVVL